MLKDSYKIERLSHEHVAYEKRDIKAIMSLFQNISYNKHYSTVGIPFTFYDAGHIPGSASIKLNIKGKNILYSGDINSRDTNLLKGAKYDYGDIDTLIIESTYGNRNHPPREQTEKAFLDEVEYAVNKGNSVIVPAFSVGRTQEILMMLAKRKFKVPIYVDGMGVKLLKAFLGTPNYIRDASKLRKAFHKAKPVQGFKHRQEIVKRQGIFVSSAGMMSGGPMIDYLKHFHNRKDVSLLITGWQAPHTNGSLILEKRKAYIDGWLVPVKCDVHQFDFSAHSGLFELQTMITKVSPKYLIINHGDPKSVDYLAEWAKKYVPNVLTPNLGSTITIK